MRSFLSIPHSTIAEVRSIEPIVFSVVSCLLCFVVFCSSSSCCFSIPWSVLISPRGLRAPVILFYEQRFFFSWFVFFLWISKKELPRNYSTSNHPQSRVHIICGAKGVHIQETFPRFLLFWHEQFREFRRLRWNERIKISLKVICGKLTKIQLLRVAEFFNVFMVVSDFTELIRRITFSRGKFTNSKMRFSDYWWSKPLTKGKISLREWTF